ncbi:MAG: ABC transporter substrate-binding protein [Ktedonobacteraceae bacterium]|nr:ABC transporter substrate-binding protein [Ktedonobacteraceae bacterium]
MSNPTTALPEDLVVTGSLTVGSYTAYPPQESINQTNNIPVGFDIDLITAIAQHMSLKIKIVSTDFQHLISKLLTRNFDVAVSAIIITPELQQRVSFIPYFIGGESLLVMKGNPLRINGLQELCGLKVAVLASTLEQKDLEMATSSCEQEKKPAIQIIVLQDQTAVIQLLLNKRVAAAYQDSPVTDYFIKQYPDHFQVAGPVVNANLEGIAIRKDDTVMFKAVQAAFTTVKTDGTYCSLIKKWGLTSGVLIENNRRIC